MKQFDLQRAVLQLRLRLGAAGPLAIGALLVLLLSLIALAWLLPQRRLLAQNVKVAAALAAASVRPAPVVVSATDNLDAFYQTLGEQRYAEQQVRTLFGIAAKSGLVLAQGEYKAAYDQNARVSTYQIVLPVKGSYQAVWQFATGVLAAVPFASLDEISFKRETIGDASVEGRVRFTLYLTGVRR